MSMPTETKEIVEQYARRVSEARVTKLERYGLKIALAERKGAKATDTDGKSYYDCYCSGGRQVLGHRRPEIVSAMREAIKQCDLGNFILMSAQKAELAKTLSNIAPGNLKNTVFGVSRGEANDFAMKLSRGATGKKEIVCFEGASHGQTAFALTATDDPKQESLFGPLIPMFKRVPADESALEKAVTDKTAAVIIEPIQSDAGVRIEPASLLKKARAVCDRHGAALIFDEGQTSFGRSGMLFESERSGVAPDILTVAQGMGGGMYPITATVFTSRLNRFMLTHPLIHLSTFGGADIGCIVAMATIDLIKKEQLCKNAEERGRQLLDGLKSIVSGRSGLKEARGAGLLIGVEAESAARAEKFVSALAASGVIALPAPGNPAVVRFTPPIDIQEKETNEILEAAEKAAKQ
jgi:acetylornithine/succinyldiaminopimelate/putrescine aminotransferase